MKKVISRSIMAMAVIAFLFQTSASQAQEDKSKRPSPPAVVSTKVGGTDVTINYSRPSVKDRKVWGEMVSYDKVWRTGANEATTFEVSTDVKIEGQPLPAGKYGLFTIPGENDWTIIFNTVHEQWGAFGYDASKDALRVKVDPKVSDEFTEKLTFDVAKNGKVTMKWEKLAVSFSVKGS